MFLLIPIADFVDMQLPAQTRPMGVVHVLLEFATHFHHLLEMTS
jgi:hypothetical protein